MITPQPPDSVRVPGSTPGSTADVEHAAERAVRTLQALLRIDTTNPPGNEAPAAALLADLLREEGLEPRIIESAPGRANVLARLRGTGEKGPLLLSAHLDVVAADPTGWTRPPFSGDEHEGWIWGRGAIDMKHFAAMCVHVLGALRRSGPRLSRDIIFAGVADEEAGCDLGSFFLVDHHPDLVRAEHALTEVGGFTTYFGGQKIYPIAVAEKGLATLRLVATGPGGHGSMPVPDSPVVRLARAVERLGTTRLPQHNTEAFTAFVQEVARTQPALARRILKLLLQPALSGIVLGKLVPDPGVSRALAASLSNTATPTVLRAGSKANVIPTRAEADVDGRTLPGQNAADLIREVKALLGEGIDVELLRETPPVSTDPASPLLELIRRTIEKHDPGAVAVPWLNPGYTDAKAWHKLGARCFGCVPLQFPPGTRFAEMYHGIDERAPVEGLKWGVRVLYDLLASHCV